MNVTCIPSLPGYPLPWALCCLGLAPERCTLPKHWPEQTVKWMDGWMGGYPVQDIPSLMPFAAWYCPQVHHDQMLNILLKNKWMDAKYTVTSDFGHQRLCTWTSPVPSFLSTSYRMMKSPRMPFVAILACCTMLGMKVILQTFFSFLITVDTGGVGLAGKREPAK